MKSHKGWGAGLHRYSVVRPEPWMDDASDDRDPGVAPGPGRRAAAEHATSSRASEFTPFAALAWTDRPAISFQFHPEFSPAFAKALIEKRYDIVPDPDAAIASLDAPNDNARVGGWIRRFLKA